MFSITIITFDAYLNDEDRVAGADKQKIPEIMVTNFFSHHNSSANYLEPNSET
jgi:hypothetical protein